MGKIWMVCDTDLAVEGETDGERRMDYWRQVERVGGGGGGLRRARGEVKCRTVPEGSRAHPLLSSPLSRHYPPCCSPACVHPRG